MQLSKTVSTKSAAVLFLELVHCDRSKKLTLQSLIKTSFSLSFLPHCNLKWVCWNRNLLFLFADRIPRMSLAKKLQ